MTIGLRPARRWARPILAARTLRSLLRPVIALRSIVALLRAIVALRPVVTLLRAVIALRSIVALLRAVIALGPIVTLLRAIVALRPVVALGSIVARIAIVARSILSARFLPTRVLPTRLLVAIRTLRCARFTRYVELIAVLVEAFLARIVGRVILLPARTWVGFFVTRPALGQDTEVMIGKLKVVFRQHAVARLLRVARERLVFLEQLRGIAACPVVDAIAHFGPPALRTLAILATPTATATGLLTIVDQEVVVLRL